MEKWYLLVTEEFLFWTWWWKIRSFFSQKNDENMIFTGYWEVLFLNVSVMGNAVFFWDKKLMERWYLLGLFELSMIFQDLGNMVFFTVVITFFVFFIFTKFVKTSLHSDESNVIGVLLYKNIDTLMTKYWHNYWRILMMF